MEEIGKCPRKRSWVTNEKVVTEELADQTTDKSKGNSQNDMSPLFKPHIKSKIDRQEEQQQALRRVKAKEGMTSIFSDEKETNHQYGSKFWRPVLSSPTGKVSVKGQFFQQLNGDVVSEREYFVSGESIFYSESNRLRQLELTFTILEEKLYLRNYKKMFALRFIHNGSITELYTTNQETFVSFYVQLFGLCMLTNFKEHFKVRGLLGQGQFSFVYEGESTVTKRVLAFKCYNKTLMREKDGGVELVKNQIKNLHYLKKFNISPLIAIFSTLDAVILVQHKAEAGDMVQYLKKQEHTFNEEMIKDIMKQIIEKVALLHAIGFIHRDLKPENILFRADQPMATLYLSDLGLTVRKEQLKLKNIKHYSCGTLGFVAPQVLKYDQSLPCYNESCDVFSIGCIFYFLHTGKPLFEGRNQKDLYLKNRDCKELQEKLNSLEQIDPHGLQLMKRLLCADPEKRIQASDACKSPLFNNSQTSGANEIIFQDTTTDSRRFIINKIEKYWSQYDSKIS